MDTHKNLIKSKTICLTGHRPKSLPWGYDESKPNCLKFKRAIKKIFVDAIQYGIDTFLTGMAEGFDMIGAEILFELRKKHNINVIAIVPCVGQEIKWSPTQKKRYKKILRLCDDIIILSQYYTPTCMAERNRFMIENSSICIACYNGKPSGTEHTIHLAKKMGNMIYIINPNNFC